MQEIPSSSTNNTQSVSRNLLKQNQLVKNPILWVSLGVLIATPAMIAFITLRWKGKIRVRKECKSKCGCVVQCCINTSTSADIEPYNASERSINNPDFRAVFSNPAFGMDMSNPLYGGVCACVCVCFCFCFCFC